MRYCRLLSLNQLPVIYSLSLFLYTSFLKNRSLFSWLNFKIQSTSTFSGDIYSSGERKNCIQSFEIANSILECTNVKMGIGEILNPMLKAILEADNRSDDEQIKISEYRSNMGASIFEKGDSLDVLLNTIETKIRQKLSSMSS